MMVNECYGREKIARFICGVDIVELAANENDFVN